MSDIYIEVPLETEPEELAQDGLDYIQANIPGWVPNDGNLETILIEAAARMTAEARDVASAVPNEIFRAFGELVGILPQEAVAATGTTDWTMINNAGYTIPAGTQIGIRIAGDELVPFTVDIDTVIIPGNTTALNVAISAVEAGADSSGISGTVELLDTLDFVTSITLDAPGTTGGVDAETDDDYLNRLSARLQLMAQQAILPNDFAILAQDIAGVERALALDLYNPNHNFLTANQSSLETDTTGWDANVNCTIARSTAQAADGAASLALTSSAAGNMAALTSGPGIACVPGEYFTAIAEFRAAASPRSVQVVINWYTSGSVFISSAQSDVTADTTSGWTQRVVSGSAPATAAFARVAVVVVATGAASEVHYADKIALRHSSSTTWAVGGTVENNNERYVTVAVVDANGLAVSSGLKAQVDAYLQARREVNFVVHVIDPTYTTIDVNFTVKMRAGFNATDVEAATEAAVASYLSPANWGLPTTINSADDVLTAQWISEPVVRYLELAQVINSVGGVDYITALTLRKASDSFASADVTLNGPAALPLGGTITGTMT